MKKIFILMLAGWVAMASASAQTSSTNWSSGFPNGGVVPDNDLSGMSIVEMTTGWSGYISDLSVTLNMSGGWNGDMYAYLYHDGVMCVLLNQVGTSANDTLGYGDSGFNITLSDTAPYSVHNYQDHSPTITGGVVQSTWQPDGASLSVFDGMDASGSWSLYLADLNQGGVMTVNNWGLQATIVPEPSILALGGMGGLSGLLLYRRICKTKTQKL